MTGETGFPDPRPYRQIASRLRKQITDGTLQPGDALPSIASIRRDTGHSRQTVSKAMRLLASEGIIFQAPGHPYCVAGSLSAWTESAERRVYGAAGARPVAAAGRAGG